MKKSWIQIDGKLIPKDEFYGNNTRGPSQQIMPDITPFVSPIDGQVINSRPQLKAHNKEHGVTNSADYGQNFEWVERRRKEIEQQQQTQGRAERIESLRRQIYRS